jgi:ParB family transcriptional regulator, chromosome partitioning protein
MPPRAKFGMGNAALLSRTATRATSLFGDDGRSLREIDVDCIKPNPNQPRRHFDEAALRGLQDSIEKHGLLQPVCVREVAADRFQLIAGERRWRAVCALQRPTIPALVMEANNPTALALIENVQREDLDALEQADGLRALADEHNATHEELGQLIGKSKAYVTRTLGILDLPPDILAEYPQNRHVPMSALWVIAEAGEPALQHVMWDSAKAGVSVRALEQAKRKAKAHTDAPLHLAPVPAIDAAFATAFRSLRNGVRTIAALRADGAAFTSRQRADLERLRSEIDAVLAEPET